MKQRTRTRRNWKRKGETRGEVAFCGLSRAYVISDSTSKGASRSGAIVLVVVRACCRRARRKTSRHRVPDEDERFSATRGSQQQQQQQQQQQSQPRIKAPR